MGEKLSLRDYQAEAVGRVLIEPTKGALIADGMGVGKTLQAVEIALRLKKDRVLIIAPVNSLPQWVERFSLQSDGAVVPRVLNSTKPGRAAFAEFLAGGAGYFLTNIEWLVAQNFMYRPYVDADGKPIWQTKKSTGEIVLKKRKAGAIGPAEEPRQETERVPLSTFVGMMPAGLTIFDEFHAIQNADSLARRTASSIKSEWRIGLSGTWHGNNFKGAHATSQWVWPGENADGEWIVTPSRFMWEDEWCEKKLSCPRCFKAVDLDAPASLDGVSPRERCVKCELKFNNGANRPKAAVVGEKVEGEFVKTLPCYIRRTPFPKPPKPLEVWVDITPAQRAQYADLEAQAVTYVQDHEGIENPVVADLPIVLRQRLRTATLGEMSGNEDGEIWFADDCVSAKMTALRGVLDSFDQSAGRLEATVIFTDSKSFAHVVTKRMVAAGKRARAWTGDPSKSAREEMKQAFMAGEFDYIVATIQSLNVAVDGLQNRCSKMVWLSESENQLLNDQAVHRVWRPGVNREAFMHVKILAHDTLDAGTLHRNIQTAARNERQMTLVAS